MTRIRFVGFSRQPCLPSGEIAAAALTPRDLVGSDLQNEHRRNAMRSFTWFALSILGAALAVPSPAPAATISGTVTGPDRAPFRGAFVQARNAKTRITVSVLSDRDG